MKEKTPFSKTEVTDNSYISAEEIYLPQFQSTENLILLSLRILGDLILQNREDILSISNEMRTIYPTGYSIE